ncbi:MAG: CRISPR-associated endonuclease Cas1 [Acidobacterium ailaaui]|nr:CRISPR-associated endonuclease Cas1 [Pseudacidobacterium ailaaui]
MLNEFAYCPRLFFYEWVESVFEHNVETLEGQAIHSRVDSTPGSLPAPEDLPQETIHSRSITLSSDRAGLIAKLDLIEGDNGVVCPVDYKRGRPREVDGLPAPWPSDRIQIAAQAIVLRDNGYSCKEGILYYASTRQRVRIVIDDALLAEAEELLVQARSIALQDQPPPPLVDSPKCPRCSLVGICLPDETNALQTRALRFEAARPMQMSLFALEPDASPAPVRQLLPARDDLRPLYLNSQGFRVGKSGEVLQIKDGDTLKQEVRLREISQINLFGNVQLSTQAIQSFCAAEIPVCYFSQGGWFYGITRGLNARNVFLRYRQFACAEHQWITLRLSRALVAGKIRNQRTMLQRNHIEPPQMALRQLKQLAGKAEAARDLEELLGIEGSAARIYFGEFAGMLKAPAEGSTAHHGASLDFRFDFTQRNRRPPRDPVNALLSLAYSLLVKDLTVTCYALGFDPYWGFYHQPRFGRPALALDLMEPFRPLIADSVVLTAINTGMVTPSDFIRSGPAVALKPGGRKSLFRAYELRMDGLVTHPLFDYRVSYRRLLEIQARLLARFLNGELDDYPVFLTH